ncbi:Amine Oxidase [Flavin-Containing] A [Manis pentadactyla]|nr:Amine Oxidase [Flavin-Containing] A [Manis pentadactyla]
MAGSSQAAAVRHQAAPDRSLILLDKLGIPVRTAKLGFGPRVPSEKEEMGRMPDSERNNIRPCGNITRGGVLAPWCSRCL